MATRIFLGAAAAIKDTWTVTIALTWAAADTATITINGKDLVVTIGSLITTAQVATTIKQAFQSEAFTDTTASVSPSGGGTSIPEHSQLTATVSGSVVTLAADTAGVPWTLTVTEVTAGTGTATGANSIVATGPNWYNNADNWSADTVPVALDDVIFDESAGGVGVFYGMDQSAVTLTSLTISSRYTGKIGLPTRNADGYDEYRDTYLKAPATTVTIGQGTGSGSGRIKLDTAAVATTINVLSTGTAAETGLGAFLFKGTNAANVLNVYGGDVGVAALAGEVATVATLRQTAGTVVCSTGCTLTTVSKLGGTLTVDSATTAITTDAGETNVLSAAHTAITVNGGTVNYDSSGTCTTLTVNNNGYVSFERRNIARTVTNCTVNDSGSLYDPFDIVTFTNAISWKGTLRVQP